MIGPFLLIGFLLGVKHALEADHVAAVASLATRSGRWRDNAKLAALWGLGHAGVLVVVGAAAILLGVTLADPWPRVFEGVVGLMLIGLGADVLRRLRRRRVHVHAHRHGDGVLHLHAHAHAEEEAHGERHPRHHHHHLPPARALLVGGVHGLAGSAALILLAVQGASSPVAAIACLIAFGVGSVLGMVLFSLAITLPLRLSAQRYGSSLPRSIEGVLGTGTMALGCWIVFSSFF